MTRIEGTISLGGNGLRNSARNSDPTYHFGPGGFGGPYDAIKDDQTAPLQDSTTQLTWTLDSSPIFHGYANVMSGGGTAFAALYAVDRLGGLHVISGPVAVTDTVSFVLVDFGLFHLDEGLKLYVRVWGPSGAYISFVSLVCRPEESNGADAIDPFAPAWVTTSGAILLNAGEGGMPPSSTYRPFIRYPVPAHDERVEIGVIYFESGDSEGFDALYNPFFAQAVINGVSLLADNFAYWSPGSTSPAWEWVDGSFLFGVTTTAEVSPGDDIELWAYGGWAFDGVHHSLLHVPTVFLGKTMETMDMTCSNTNDASRTVGYSHPRPGAIESYEARVYYYNSGDFYLKEVVESNITDDPYVFPPQPPTGLADPAYLLMIRAYYYDGSWIQDSCFYTPPAPFAVFRTRHKAHS